MLGILMIKIIFLINCHYFYTQVWSLWKTFTNGSLANITLSKTQLYKRRQSGGCLERPLESVIKTILSLIGHVLSD